jgi:hypothetical protein
MRSQSHIGIRRVCSAKRISQQEPGGIGKCLGIIHLPPRSFRVPLDPLDPEPNSPAQWYVEYTYAGTGGSAVSKSQE